MCCYLKICWFGVKATNKQMKINLLVGVMGRDLGTKGK